MLLVDTLTGYRAVGRRAFKFLPLAPGRCRLPSGCGRSARPSSSVSLCSTESFLWPLSRSCSLSRLMMMHLVAVFFAVLLLEIRLASRICGFIILIKLEDNCDDFKYFSSLLPRHLCMYLLEITHSLMLLSLLLCFVLFLVLFSSPYFILDRFCCQYIANISLAPSDLPSISCGVFFFSNIVFFIVVNRIWVFFIPSAPLPNMLVLSSAFLNV